MSSAETTTTEPTQLFVKLLEGLKNGNYTFIALSIWFLWDWAITLDQEVEHFWTKKWTIPTYLYFANRYIMLLIIIFQFQASIGEKVTRDRCSFFVYILFALAAVCAFIVQVILTLRTYALWDCNKTLLQILMVVSIGGFLAQVCLIVASAGRVEVTFNPLPAPYTGCIASFPGLVWHRLVPRIVFELLMTSLILIKFASYAWSAKTSRIAYVLLRDGFIECIVITVINILSLVIEIAGPEILIIASYNTTCVVGTVCSSRILLNIRDVMKTSKLSEDVLEDPWYADHMTLTSPYGPEDMGTSEVAR